MNFYRLKGHAEVVKTLIANGANPNALETNGTLPSFVAVKNGKQDYISSEIGMNNVIDKLFRLRQSRWCFG